MTDTQTATPSEPTFKQWKKHKAAYARWGKSRNPVLEDFREAVREMARSRDWTDTRTLKWIARSTGVSLACLQNWMESGSTRHPSYRTFPYVMEDAFGVHYERRRGQ